jgi:hypothetical protein
MAAKLRKEEVGMSSQPYDDKVLHERVSFGGDARPSTRRSGVTLSRPGHFMAIGSTRSAAAESTQETGRRAVRAQIKLPPESNVEEE